MVSPERGSLLARPLHREATEELSQDQPQQQRPLNKGHEIQNATEQEQHTHKNTREAPSQSQEEHHQSPSQSNADEERLAAARKAAAAAADLFASESQVWV